MKYNILTGVPFSGSAALNVLIILVEIAAAAGVYASPAIIWRYAVARAPVDGARAGRFNLVFTPLFAAAAAAVLIFFRQSLLPLLGVAVWCPFNCRILTGAGDFITRLFDRYSELAVYLIVGVITTIVSWGVFAVLSLVLDSENGFLLTLNTVLNWSAGVAVAYPLNRMWVFHSERTDRFREFLEFTASRLTTLGIEAVVMLLCVDVLGINQYVSKYVIASLLVIILNYVFSKLFVFKSKGRAKGG